MESSTSQTFTLTINGKKVNPPTDNPPTVSLTKVLDRCDIAKEKKGRLLTSTNPTNAVMARLNNSFVGSLFSAYSNHHKLVLRPDDLWLTIAIAFADYVNYHAEEMRSSFATHDGKKLLTVYADSGALTADNWSGIINKFSNAINENTLGSVRDWLEPNFTTTTSNDSLIARVALMGAMKNYFNFKCCIECGIPEVTLMGTLADWQKLHAKVEKLADYGKDLAQDYLVWWRDILIPIVNEFIASYEGKVNENFWQSCVNYLGGGSGPSYLSGWILAFAPFVKGKWRINHPDKIKTKSKYGKVETTDFKSSATVEVPLVVDDNGHVYNACFYAGGIVNLYDRPKNIMRPRFDFALFEMPN
jgi:hypothetical protein